MPRTALALLVGLFFISFTNACHAQNQADLIICNGKIVDGTGNPWFYGDLAISGDRISAIGNLQNITAKREIDATGLVVAPGFIDIHSHSDFLLLEDGHAQSKIRQGVTTEILGEGNSAGPYQGKLSPRTVTVRGKKRTLTRLGHYFSAVDDAGVATNVATYVGIGNLWRSVMGSSFDRPTESQFQQMEALLHEAMRDGALGLSTQVMFPPGSLAKTADLIRLGTVVEKHQGIYSSHIRNEGLGIFEAVREAIAVGEKANIPVDIIHLKIADEQYWGRMNEVTALISSARKRGVNVQANVYPYTRGNNNLVSIIPPWAHEGGKPKLIERLKDAELRKKMKRDINSGIPGWYNHYTAVGKDWGRMLVSANNSYKGLTMDRVMAARTAGRKNVDLLDELFDILIEENGSVSTVYAHHTEKDMNRAMIEPWCSIGSDGSAYATSGPLRRGNPHPRNLGTFPRVLGVYVREFKILKLENAIRKMTSLNAAKVGLKDRGLLKTGNFADVTVFNPETVIDKATYIDPFQYPEGIETVIVNGQIVLHKGKHTGATPGRALRKTGHVSLFAKGAKPQQLLKSGAGEGPAWHPKFGLLMSGGGHINQLAEDGTQTVFRKNAGTNGLLFDAKGNLLACEPVQRRVTRMNANGKITVLTDNFEGKPYNQPNDITVDSKGRIYFSDPKYGPRTNLDLLDADGRVVEGVYRIDLDGTVARIITHEADRPNGLLVTPDDKYLFVADNNNNTAGASHILWRFDLQKDGTVDTKSRKLIFDWQTGRGPDGMASDMAGNLYVAGGRNKPVPPFETADKFKGGIYVFNPAGKFLEFVSIPNDEVTNCSFGGKDLKTLYITAGGTLWTIRTKTAGRVLWK